MVGSWGHVLSREQDVCHCLSMPYLDLDIPEQRDAQKQEAENKGKKCVENCRHPPTMPLTNLVTLAVVTH